MTTGQMVTVNEIDRPVLIARMFAKRDIDESGCWLWTGAINGIGYGVVRRDNQKVFAHRLSYALHCGPIPAGLVIDHLCNTKLCFNPEHLELVTGRENARRYAATKTHCKRGHEFTSENTYVMPSGHRHCRKCRALRQAAARQAHALSKIESE